MIKSYCTAFFFLFALVLHIFTLKAQTSHIQYNFKKLNSEHGLSNSIVYGILQDKKGYMWFTTQDGGVNQFDGYNFKIFKHSPKNINSIPSNNTNCIIEDKKGNIWISTWGNGVAEYSPAKDVFKTYRNDEKNKNSISSNKVQSLMLDDEDIWLGTADGGLNLIEGKTQKIKIYRHDPKNPNSLSNNRVWSLVKDKNNIYWIATSDGLNAFDKNTNTFTVYKNKENNPNSLMDNLIRSLVIDNKGYIWIGTGKGLDKFDPTTKKFQHYHIYETNEDNILKNKINAVFADKKGIIWIGTQMGGLNRLDPKTGLMEHYTNHPNNQNSISYDDVRSITQDCNGLIWVSTRGGGVNYFDPNEDNFSSITSNTDNSLSIKGKRVTSLSSDKDGRVWIGTDAGGINVYDPIGQTMTYYNKQSQFGKLNSNFITAVLADQTTGNIWIGTYDSGLGLLDPKTGNTTYYNKNNADVYGLDYNEINTLFKDPSLNLWVGTNNGVYRYHPTTKHFKRYSKDPNNTQSISDNRIIAIGCDKEKQVWIGTENGLYQFDSKTEKFKQFRHNPKNEKSINSNRIYSFYTDKKGNFWIGTEFGLNLFDPKTGNFKSYNEKDGFTGSAILSISEDSEDNLWLSTTTGLIRFRYPEASVKNFDAADGLLSNEFLIGSGTKNKYGYIFFGNREGVNFLKPENIKPKNTIPKISLTDFFLFDQLQVPSTSKILSKTMSYTDTIILSHKDFVFSFEYTAFDYMNPSKNKYAYKMEGFDNEWIISSRRFATYTSLPDGKYIFRVKASNSRGIWNNKGISILVIIKPPFWKTWWFYLICSIAAAASVIGFIKIRTRFLENEKIHLENIVQERTIEISKQKDEIEAQRDWANKQRSEITSSIQYARRIQGAILPPIEYLNLLVEDFFIFYKPKDIVSGDFYYAEEIDNKIIIAVADCTGHGVPGAFMSLLGISFLTEIISKLHNDLENKAIDEIHAGYILDCLKTKLVTSLHQNGKLGNSKDGMDIALLVIDKEKRELEFSGANNPIIIASEGQLTTLSPNKMPIGYRPNSNQNFGNQTVPLHENDIVYLYSDGYLDQFGGPKGRKFLSKNFILLLERISNMELDQQKEIIQNNFFDWKGSNLQVDDILVMGIRII